MSEHEWIRTVPTDGRWCELCGLAEARDVGDPCPGEGAAREVERRMMARLGYVWAQGFMTADPDADPVQVARWNPYQ